MRQLKQYEVRIQHKYFEDASKFDQAKLFNFLKFRFSLNNNEEFKVKHNEQDNEKELSFEIKSLRTIEQIKDVMSTYLEYRKPAVHKTSVIEL